MSEDGGTDGMWDSFSQGKLKHAAPYHAPFCSQHCLRSQKEYIVMKEERQMIYNILSGVHSSEVGKECERFPRKRYKDILGAPLLF